MGRAMAAQSAKAGPAGLGGVFGGKRTFGGKAKLHTTRAQRATVNIEPVKYWTDGVLI